MTPKPTVWTAEMVAVLHAHSWGRKTPAEIGAMLGVSESKVACKFRKLGIGYTSKTQPAQRVRILHYASLDYLPLRIARTVGLPVSLVEVHLAMPTPPAPRRPPQPTHLLRGVNEAARQRVVELVAEGWRPSRIVTRVDVDLSMVEAYAAAVGASASPS